MATKKTENISLLPVSTIIEVICIKGNEILKKEMTIEAAAKMVKEPGCKYINYQLGYSQFIETVKK